MWRGGIEGKGAVLCLSPVDWLCAARADVDVEALRLGRCCSKGGGARRGGAKIVDDGRENDWRGRCR